jgi:hypothetical protein
VKTVFCSGSLGDTLVISGAILLLARRYGKLRYAVLPAYERSVRDLFIFYPEIEVLTVKVEEVPAIVAETAAEDLILLNTPGAHLLPPRFEEESWATWMYRQAGISFEERWKSCPVRSAAWAVEQVPWPPGVGFLHDDPERGFRIEKFPKYPVVFQRVKKGEAASILSYAEAIEDAPEVHLIDSAFVHLTESLRPRGRLFLHRYARFWRKGWYDIPLRHKWTIIDDEDLQSRARAWHVIMSNLQMYPERTMIRAPDPTSK